MTRLSFYLHMILWSLIQKTKSANFLSFQSEIFAKTDFWELLGITRKSTNDTSWSISVFGDFMHLHWIQKLIDLIFLFSPNSSKDGPQKLQIGHNVDDDETREKMRNLKLNVGVTTNPTSTVRSMESNFSLSSTVTVYITPSVSFIINMEARIKKIF